MIVASALTRRFFAEKFAAVMVPFTVVLPSYCIKSLVIAAPSENIIFPCAVFSVVKLVIVGVPSIVRFPLALFSMMLANCLSFVLKV